MQSLFLCGEEGFRKKSSAVVSNGTCGLSNLNTPHNLDVLWIDPNHRLKEDVMLTKLFKSPEWRAHVLGIPPGRRCRYIPSVAANDPRAGSAYRISSVDAPTTRDQWWDAAKLQSPDSGLAQDCWRSFQF